MGMENSRPLPAPENEKVYTVSELTNEVRTLLEDEFPRVLVEGEISNFARPASGHCYFTLRDAAAALRCVMYRSMALRLPKGFEPRDGLEVVASGRLSVYAARGEYQLQVDRLIPKGIGAAELALRQLREKLFNLGYFDQKRKRSLPMYPRNVCLIASATGAAVRDMIEVFRRRWPATTLFVRHSRVQGDGAAEEIAEAIRQVNRHHAAGHLPLDVLILGRGGGSTEDLAAFNTEVVAQAIYQSKIPVVSAVGHEIDYTIADLVADVRAATPSHAVEVVAPDRTEVWEIVEQRRCRLLEAIKRTLSERRERLALLAGRPVLRRPADRFREWERRLDEWGERLVRSIQNRTTALKRDLGAIAQHLESLSPLAILARGYSLTRRIDSNDFIRSVDQVAVGDRIVTIVQHGSIISRVESTSV